MSKDIRGATAWRSRRYKIPWHAHLGKFWSADGSAVERHVSKVMNLIGDGHLNAFELIYGASVPGEPSMPAPPDDSATECLVRSRA